MTGTVRFHLLRVSRALWFLPTVFCVLAVSVVGVASVLEPLVPRVLVEVPGLGVVEEVLRILASSMLAVAIFSLTTMVTSLEAASRGQRRAHAYCSPRIAPRRQRSRFSSALSCSA